MVLAAWLDAARGLHVPAVFLFAAALKLSIFVCRNPISLAPFSAKFSTLAMLQVFHRMLCQDLTTVRSAALFCLCVSTGSTGSAQHWHSCSCCASGPVSFRGYLQRELLSCVRRMLCLGYSCPSEPDNFMFRSIYSKSNHCLWL